MADKEIKAAESAEKKPAKKKSGKPSVFSRMGAWLKSCKAEMKKVVWASWSMVRSNSIMVIISVLILGAVIGALDYLLSQAIVTLSVIF